jgi:Cu+-exporting ATPase
MKNTLIAVLIAGVLIGGALMLGNGKTTSQTEASIANVSVVNGKQIIAISAKGGYSPALTAARADMPTVIKMDTQGTFDCSSSLAIPSLGLNKILPPSGQTEIEIPPQKAGTTMQGLCAMGMYNFSIQFN